MVTEGDRTRHRSAGGTGQAHRGNVCQAETRHADLGAALLALSARRTGAASFTRTSSRPTSS